LGQLLLQPGRDPGLFAPLDQAAVADLPGHEQQDDDPGGDEQLAHHAEDPPDNPHFATFATD
jgi:hypothetical protein